MIWPRDWSSDVCPSDLTYLRERGIQADTIKKFDIGWAPNEWQALARVFDSYQQPELLETGLIAQGREGRRYERLRGRIVFAIRNYRGHTVGFGVSSEEHKSALQSRG